MISGYIPRAAILCFLAGLVTLFHHLPCVIFPSSLSPIYYTRHDAAAQSDNSTQFDHDASSSSIHYFHPASNFHPNEYPYHQRRQGKDVERHYQTKEDDYQASVTKGWALRCLMDATMEEAQDMVQNSPKWKNLEVESRFIDPLMSPLEWGWVTKTLDLKDAPQILSDYRIEKMLEFLHVSTNLKSWTQQLVSHEREWYSEDGRTGPAIKVPPPSRGGARYKTLFNGLNGDKSDATMVFLEMYAPVPEIEALQKFGFLPKGKLNAPDLQKTSDLVFLNYYLVGATEMKWPDVELDGGSKIPCPRHIIIPFIDNAEVTSILETVFRKTSRLWDAVKDAPIVRRVPGVRFDAGSEAGMAILGTRHGAAVSFLLLQHKKAFGVQAVSEVRVWHEIEGGDLVWYLYFEIGSVGETVSGAGTGEMKARL